MKPKAYLVKIITPTEYHTEEEATKDKTEYMFRVYDDMPYLEGSVIDDEGEDGRPRKEAHVTDRIRQKNLERYRLFRLKEIGKDELLNGKPIKSIKPCGKAWNKLFPAYGCYPLIKLDSNVIALSEVKEGGLSLCRFP